MTRLSRFLGPLVLASAMIVPLVGSGCEGRVRVYDEYHSDYHHWDRHEVGAYHAWVGERRYDYVEYDHMDRDRQKEYWNWRHDHPKKY